MDEASIRNNYLVFGLNEEQLDCVAGLATERTLKEAEYLCRQGEPGGEMYIVLEGRLRVETIDGDLLAEVGPNSVLGEMGLIGSRPRSASVVALTDVRLAAIRSRDLHEEMVADGHTGFLILYNITRVLSERLFQADEKLSSLMHTAINPN